MSILDDDPLAARDRIPAAYAGGTTLFLIRHPAVRACDGSR
jgi:hypothetical protein